MRTHRFRTVLLTAAAAAAVFTVTAGVLASARQQVPAPATSASTPQGALEQARLAARDNPTSDQALTALAVAALNLQRETGDPTLYPEADDAARKSLALNPKNPETLDALGSLALSRHRFAEALDWARKSLAAEPDRFAPLPIASDSLVELGRYKEGFALVARRLNLRPDFPSYSRASYAAELVGDRRQAKALMRLALDTAPPGSSDRTWSLVHLGHLEFGEGKLAAAERFYVRALAVSPDDAAALAGRARISAARGDLTAATRFASQAAEGATEAEYPALLAEIDGARGDDGAVRRHLQQALAAEKGHADNGVSTELDNAAMLADFRRPSVDDVKRARKGYVERPGIVSDSALGWVLTRAGMCEEGLRYATRSLRLGTKDATFSFRAGMAAKCAGRPAAAARHLGTALRTNPYFSVRHSPVARETLNSLGG
jgi:tetratricopeptide (TPR) repeat protein